MELRLIPLAILVIASFSSCRAISFGDTFDIIWSPDHLQMSPDGQTWDLKLDNITGSGFRTKSKYRYGWFSMKIKLAGGDSAGVVTTFYMCSDLDAGLRRDEIDFEFIGNRTGQPYAVQTNIFKNGGGGREMRHDLWFDPTQDFHSYSVLWNNHRIAFFVDDKPIRVSKNTKRRNKFFPNKKPMYLFSTIWNGDSWATRGGVDKVNWSSAPFVSSNRDFQADGCQWSEPNPACAHTTTQNWWDQINAWQLSEAQKRDFVWVQKNYVRYDYCKDRLRYPKIPRECLLNPLK